MKNRLASLMKDAEKTFRSHARKGKSDWLSDNFYILERQAERAYDDCRKSEHEGLIDSLFERCSSLCPKGILCSEEKLVEHFLPKGLSGTETAYLPVALTCALLDKAAKGVRMRNESGEKQLSNAVTSLRKMGSYDFDMIGERLFAAEEYFQNDPEGIYRAMDSDSKRVYRQRLSAAAAKAKKSERDFADAILKKAKESGRHIGEYIIPSRKSTSRGWAFLIMEILMPLSVSVAAGFFFAKPWVGILLFFPLWELMRYPIESVSVKGVAPKRFLRLSVDDERVLNAHTLITVTTVMPAAEKLPELEKHLEEIYLSNCMGNIKVCCLCDFKSADMPTKPEDRILLRAITEMTDRLNKKHGSGFIVAVRPRAFSETQNEFIGREKKRGAITELIRAVKGKSKGFSLLYGDIAELEKTKYIIALDADTGLVFDCARELVAIAEHPVNRPVIKDGRVVRGYGLLVPKSENSLKEKNGTFFSAVMAGDSGVAAYDTLTNERYQDLFAEGIFCGKGLINVDAFYTLLDKGMPKERILSHDIVESGYLRAAYIPDVQITESFPKNAGSYFQRLERWIRGDWQNIGFVFGKNPLNFLSRYKMFDNLRRSLTPALCIFALCFTAVVGGFDGAAVATVSLFALCSRNLHSAFSSLFSGGFSMISRLYYSKTLPAALNGFAKAFVSVCFSAREAYTGISAASKALWRLYVSKKNLLEWTTAAQSDAEKNRKSFVGFIPAAATSVFLLIFGLPIHRLAGIIILADIPLTLLSGIGIRRKRTKLGEPQRETLLSYASAMWGFFEELCGKENNFLPPDNIQFSPASAVARRTSPTNIGLMLTSFLAARDLGFISSAELAMRLNLSLGSIEKLEKYEGNLLNWYSTETLEPLTPKFVSTVDSGNFLCCLTALKEGLKEYAAECPSLNGIIERIEKLLSETNLLPLYNRRRKLFHIGIDAVSGEKTESFYDLYMSEARMTAYFAVARRIVPKNHWGAMGRILVGQSRYTGLASWTGTMFEYFMPNLFIPAPSGSLTDESQRFCLFCQQKRAGRRPYGISESGFYAFDASLNYQYKAHGVQKLGLKRGLDSETVISPYSTFLTLTTAPVSAMKNLKRLEKLGAYGRFGFYEAIDFTKGRGGADGAVIRSFMSHHVGMSMLSAVNMLKNNCMQRRFMSDSFMNGAKSLLEEKIQTGARVFRDIKTEEIPQIRERVQGKNTVSENPTPFHPKAAVFSNGRLTTCITDTGAGMSLFDGLDVTAFGEDLLSAPKGIFAVFVTEKEIIPFVSAIDRNSGAKFKAEFSKNKAVHTSVKNGLRLKMETTVEKKKNCEQRKFILENSNAKTPLKGKLIIYFDPCLEKRAAYAAHPAFSKLFLTDEWDEENGCLVFSRRERDSQKSCAVAAGIAQNEKISAETSREKVLTTPCGVFSLGEKTDFACDRGNPDCCCAFSVEIELRPREKKAVTMFLAVEETKELAVNTFLTAKSAKNAVKSGSNIFYVGTFDNAVANAVLPMLLFPQSSGNRLKTEKRCNYRRGDLWSIGISGDYPVVLVQADDTESLENIRPYIRLNKALRSCGITSDLAVAYAADEGYVSPIENGLKKLLKEENCSLMFGVGGGVHGVNLSAHSYAECCSLRETAVYAPKSDFVFKSGADKAFKPLRKAKSPTAKNQRKKADSVKRYNFTDSEITIKKQGETVDIPWNMVFANQSFGTMVSDKSLGFTWALNSRENKLTPWSNDTMSDNVGEILFVKYNGVLYDLAAIGRVKFTPQKAEWKAEIEKIKFTVTVSVPDKGMAKKCTVEAVNNSKKTARFDLIYYTVPVLGVSENNRGVVYSRRLDNGAVSESSFGEFSGFSALTCSGKADYVCFSRQDLFEGKFDEKITKSSDSGCISVGKKLELSIGEKKVNSFFLSWGASENAALLMPESCNFDNKTEKKLKFSAGNAKTDLFCNSFLYSQIKQSRFYGRTGFYQCSGAYGFRDQLQDSLAFLKTEPEIIKRHIFRCAAVQFEQGDVLHWWHVILDKKQKIKGIRTRCSDDMLWLPYACLCYAEETGDSSLFDAKIPYLKGEPLKPDETERYFSPQRTDYKESLLCHCIRAVDFSLNFGKNGLPLIGSCDWNDGLSKIGATENAESVWLGMFQIIVLEKMAVLCNNSGLTEKSDEYSRIAERLKSTIEEKAWQGDRYARLILENGKIFGSGSNFIDILPQAFSAFAGLGKDGRAEIALKTAYEMLFDENSGVIRLLSPPFGSSQTENVGYIAAYPEGIRENGGQYTHAAVWLAAAMFEKGMTNEAEKLINALNPLTFYETEEKAAAYRAEPYVLAGDVSYAKGVCGRAGWTHFTGSAAWYYRTVYKYLNRKM